MQRADGPLRRGATGGGATTLGAAVPGGTAPGEIAGGGVGTVRGAGGAVRPSDHVRPPSTLPANRWYASAALAWPRAP